MQLARSTIAIAQGRLGEGWDDYEARLDPSSPADAASWSIARAGRPGVDLAGKTLLLMGEQGLGDEVLFANMLPDMLEALGPDGRLVLAVEPRLVSLFQRSFPAAEVLRPRHLRRARRARSAARRSLDGRGPSTFGRPWPRRCAGSAATWPRSRRTAAAS